MLKLSLKYILEKLPYNDMNTYNVYDNHKNIKNACITKNAKKINIKHQKIPKYAHNNYSYFKYSCKYGILI